MGPHAAAAGRAQSDSPFTARVVCALPSGHARGSGPGVQDSRARTVTVSRGEDAGRFPAASFDRPEAFVIIRHTQKATFQGRNYRRFPEEAWSR